MKALLNWLDSRTGVSGFVHEALYERIPGGARWRYVWGSTLVFAFTVQVITGIFLWMCYSPSAQTAWESVFYIQHEMAGGWLLRGLHHFMAQAMVVLMGLHLMQVVIDGAYRAPREVNFWLGLILMQIVLGLSLTGYLLPWDQKGYWATRVATNLLSVVPLVGTQLQDLVVGGSDYGHHTLTRFFALHAGVLPGLLVFFLVIHVSLFRRHGICWKQPAKGPECMFWPDQLLKDAVACLAVLVVVLVLMSRPLSYFSAEHVGAYATSPWGAELGAPADPADQYSAARPEWYFLFLFQFLKLFEGWGEQGELLGAVVIPLAALGALFLMPLLGRWKLGHRFNIAMLVMLLAGVGWLTVTAFHEDFRAREWWTDPASFDELKVTIKAVGTDDKKIAEHFGNDEKKIQDYKDQVKEFEKYEKSKQYLKAVEQAEADAERAVVLASGPKRIPQTGAITLMRNDPKTQGPKLFAQYCASCHTYQSPDQPTAADKEPPTAANLYGFASRAWIASLLNPQRIVTTDYFGGTSHKEGEMVSFVTETLKDWPAEEVQSIAMALSAEAALPAQAEADKKDAARIEAGRKLIADSEKCVSCHKFREAGELGSAPDLTGYGSREWLIGMIGNPTHERFYRDANDRMPAFAEHPDEPLKNMLSPHAIGMIADWLRGEWYEPGQAAVDAPAADAKAETPAKAESPAKAATPEAESPAAEAAKPDVPPADAPKSEEPMPDAPKPEEPKPDAPPKPDTPPADAPKPDAPKPDAPKPEPKPDAPPTPEEPKPDAPKPDAPKPEDPKPDAPPEAK